MQKLSPVKKPRGGEGKKAGLSQSAFIKKLKKAKESVYLSQFDKERAKSCLLNEIKLNTAYKAENNTSEIYAPYSTSAGNRNNNDALNKSDYLLKKTLSDAKNNIALTQEEKSRIEKDLKSIIKTKEEAGADTPLKGAYKKVTQLFEDAGESAQQGLFASKLLRIGVVVMLITASMSGLAYGANNSLPGDKLYGIKTNVNESAKMAIARSPEKKADMVINSYRMRLQETQQLAQQARLTNKNTEILLENMEKHENELNNIRSQARTVESQIALLEKHAELSKTLNENTSLLAEIQQPEKLQTAYLQNNQGGLSTEARKRKWKKALNERNLMRVRFHTSITEHRVGMAKLSIASNLAVNHAKELPAGKVSRVLENLTERYSKMIASYFQRLEARDELREIGVDAERRGDAEKQREIVQQAEDRLRTEREESVASSIEWKSYQYVAHAIQQSVENAERERRDGNYAYAAENLEDANKHIREALNDLYGEVDNELKLTPCTSF